MRDGRKRVGKAHRESSRVRNEELSRGCLSVGKLGGSEVDGAGRTTILGKRNERNAIYTGALCHSL